jgi:hypothetical protein
MLKFSQNNFFQIKKKKKLLLKDNSEKFRNISFVEMKISKIN